MWFPKDKAPAKSVLWPIVFKNESLSRIETLYNNIERETVDIQHCLEKLHHYCFASKVSVIKDHRHLVAIFKKDVATCQIDYKEFCNICISKT